MPVPYSKSGLPIIGEFPFGLLHAPADTCPFDGGTHSRDFVKTCCSFNGRGLFQALCDYGHEGLAGTLAEDRTPYETGVLSDMVERIAASLGRPIVVRRKAEEARAIGEREYDWEMDLGAEEEAAEVEQTLLEGATWLRKVCEHGFGVTTL
ncbi:MAG: hypothetical protein ACHREM_07160 [Polyangiales bacterium]